ncbi:hypothetical protein GJ700_22610 [Duganella sp. FT92W]|uniref:Uncharacterized protein n=1 Tax=Pseudoduganella rivuli TaxID=2666085 RepID=A0A7X2LW32_9BURK|nr:hypothetical protein [Pseudoduganella rivuli]MRV74504.1 hypothetical protein [Pseudoduganella rivuli]
MAVGSVSGVGSSPAQLTSVVNDQRAEQARQARLEEQSRTEQLQADAAAQAQQATDAQRAEQVRQSQETDNSRQQQQESLLASQTLSPLASRIGQNINTTA